MTILVIAAHPDDEVLGCGGTIARMSREGIVVNVAILGEGITSRYRERKHANRGLVKSLRASSWRAGKVLGAKNLLLRNFPDNRFDEVSLIRLVKAVEDLISKYRPAVVYTHWSGDLNIDHALTNRAVITATRPTGRSTVKEIYAFEVPSSTEWGFGLGQRSFSPNVFIDISSTLTTKVRALREYESEMRPFPHPRSAEVLESLARIRGSASGVEAAEAFELVRRID